jgi:hypothetical protein
MSYKGFKVGDKVVVVGDDRIWIVKYFLCYEDGMVISSGALHRYTGITNVTHYEEPKKAGPIVNIHNYSPDDVRIQHTETKDGQEIIDITVGTPPKRGLYLQVDDDGDLAIKYEDEDSDAMLFYIDRDSNEFTACIIDADYEDALPAYEKWCETGFPFDDTEVEWKGESYALQKYIGNNHSTSINNIVLKGADFHGFIIDLNNLIGLPNSDPNAKRYKHSNRTIIF